MSLSTSGASSSDFLQVRHHMARLLSENRVLVPSAAGAVYLRSHVFTNSDTWTTDADATQLIIWATGGGAGGGVGGPSYNHGGGGASGATAWKVIKDELLSSYGIAIGAGGSGRPSSGSHVHGFGGGDTVFHSNGASSHPHYLLAQGGLQSGYHNNGDASQGVVITTQADCTGADVCHRGSMGHAAGGGDADDDRPNGGAVGGASFWGSGGQNGNFGDSLDGKRGRAWGSGGGPGIHKQNVGNGASGDGASGIIIVEVYG